MTKLKFINVFLLQWFFIRLTKCNETIIEDFQLHSWDFVSNGSVSSRGSGTQQKYEWFGLKYYIVPLSGWCGTKFKFLRKVPRFKRITKKIKI